MTLGEKLYTLRTKQNMTQEQLAEKLQVSRQSISKWESDATRPDLGKLKFLAEFDERFSPFSSSQRLFRRL